MSKVDVVAAAKAVMVQAQDVAVQAFGEACYDGGLAEAPKSGFSQDDIDAAVAAAKADAAVALAALQQSLDEMAAKEQMEEKVVADVQAKLDAIKAILNPA